MEEKRDDSLSNRDNCIQKERQMYFEFLTMVASSVKLMLDRACSNYHDWDIRWVENWLDCQSQKVVGSGSESSWRSLSGFDSGAWPDNRTDCLISEVTIGTKSGGAVNKPSHRARPSCTGT